MSVLTGQLAHDLRSCCRYENAGLSDMLSRRGFGGGLWGKPLRKLFSAHDL